MCKLPRLEDNDDRRRCVAAVFLLLPGVAGKAPAPALPPEDVPTASFGILSIEACRRTLETRQEREPVVVEHATLNLLTSCRHTSGTTPPESSTSLCGRQLFKVQQKWERHFDEPIRQKGDDKANPLDLVVEKPARVPHVLEKGGGVEGVLGASPCARRLAVEAGWPPPSGDVAAGRTWAWSTSRLRQEWSRRRGRQGRRGARSSDRRGWDERKKDEAGSQGGGCTCRRNPPSPQG